MILRCFCSFAIVYAMAAFVNLQWDLTLWSEGYRLGVIVFGLLLAFFWN